MSREVMQQAREVAALFRSFKKSSHAFYDGRPLHEVAAELLEVLAASQPADLTALRKELAKPDHIPDAGKMVQMQRVPVSIAQILRGFPLLDDEGLDEEKHYWKWALQQDRKLLHAMLTALPQRQPLTAAMVQESKMLDDYNERGIFIDGWLKAEAAHDIKGSNA